jgi:hypothetical protein
MPNDKAQSSNQCQKGKTENFFDIGPLKFDLTFGF